MATRKVLTTELLQVYEEKFNGTGELVIRYKQSRMKTYVDGANCINQYHFLGKAFVFLFKVKHSSMTCDRALIDGFKTLRIISLTKCASIILKTIEYDLKTIDNGNTSAAK
jgi:hypothetical protein